MITALLIAAAPAFAQDFEVRPSTIGWDALSKKAFDRRWTLPERRREGRDLLQEMRRLAVLRCRVELGEGRTASCFGDLVVAARELDGPARIEWFEELGERAPKLVGDWGAGLSELLLDDHLHSDEWSPRRDHQRDGMLIADDWELDESYGSPWTELDVDVRLHQVAALFHADLATIKAVEFDFRSYPENVGADYEEIYPIRDRYSRGEGPDGAFTAVDIKFRCDLPFPFSDYSCRLHLLNRVDSDGLARTDIYSTSSDFHYLAGRDVFLPVLDSSGEQVAFLAVRHFGFNLDGVPDKRHHRVDAMRASFGNLKRNSEARYVAGDESFGPPAKAISGIRVLGRK